MWTQQSAPSQEEAEVSSNLFECVTRDCLLKDNSYIIHEYNRSSGTHCRSLIGAVINRTHTPTTILWLLPETGILMQ